MIFVFKYRRQKKVFSITISPLLVSEKVVLNNDFQNSTQYLNCLENIFIDRGKELDLIKHEYDKFVKGGMGVVCVAGVSGIGKTYLLDYAFRQHGPNALIYSKNRNNERRALISISEIIDQIVDHLLTLPKRTLDSIAVKLYRTISDDIALLSSICPKIVNIINIKSQIDIKDFNRLKYKVKNTIYKFIDIASRFLFPLVIHIDDLQWADELSLDIIKALLSKKQILNIMLALSYRENNNMHKLIGSLEKTASFICLQPLNFSAVKKYIQYIYKDNIDNLDHLTSLILGLTLGNPFYIKETLLILMQKNIIIYSDTEKSWRVRVNRMNDFLINDDVEKVIKNKIIEETDNLLEIIACFGGKIEYSMLKLLFEKNEEALKLKLQRLVDSAIIIKQEEDGRTVYLFTHDIINKLVLGSFSSAQKQKTHYKIADSVFSDISINIANKESFIASHLLNANKEHLYENTDKWLNLLYDAGMIEKHRASLYTALKNFELCKDMLNHTSVPNADLYLNLHLELAECYNLCNRQKASKEIMRHLIDRYQDDHSRLAIKRKQLYLYYYQREHKKTLETGASILRDIRFGFGRYRLGLDLVVSRIIYSNKKIRSLSEASGAIDEKVSIALDTLTIMNACAAVSNDRLTAAIGLSAALASAKCGESANSLVGYISYAYILYIVWNDLPKTKMMVQQILKMSQRISDHNSKSMVFFMIGAFLSHWSEPIAKTDDYLQKGIEYGDLSGDFLFLGHCITTSLDTKSFMGKSLDNISAYIEDCKTKYSEAKQYTTTYNLAVYTDHIAALKHGRDDHVFEEIGCKYPKLTPFEKLTEQTLQMERLLLTNRLADGFRLVKTVAPQIKSTKGLICRLSIIFYSVLIRTGVHSCLAHNEQLSSKTQIKRMLKELAYWAGLRADNFEGYYLLANAEYQTYIEGRSSDLYDIAISHADLQGNLKLGALANFLAAKKHQTNTKLSRFYATESARLHKLRGADYISRLVEKEYGLADSVNSTDAPVLPEGTTQTRADLLRDYMKQAAGRSEDDTIELLLDTILQTGLADYSCVLIKESHHLYLKHQKSKDGSAKSFSEKVNIRNLSRLPHKVIRYVSRTQKDVCLAPHRTTSIFDTDPYIAENTGVFIACFPIINCDILTGLLYLENHAVTFDDEAVWEIKSLLPALAVSLTGINGVNINDLFAPVKMQTLLTDREMDILKLLAEGLSNESIGSKLGLSLGTIKKHVSSIMSKLGANNRIQALIKAKDKNII